MTDSETTARLARLWMDAQPSVLSFICAAIPRFHDAEDVLQNVAIDVARNFWRYDENRPFVAWAIGIARVKVADHFRKQQRDTSLLSGETLDQVAAAHVQQHTQINELRSSLEECLEELGPAARTMVQMRYADDLKSPAIAEQIESTSGSVRVTLNRIRTRLSECMDGKLKREANR